MACLGAVVSGALVAWINIDHGYGPALIAALKQAAYAFVATGLILQFCRWLAMRQISPWLAGTMAVAIPLSITMALLYGVHSLKGTPEPLYSIVPGTVLSLTGLVLITRQTMSARARAGHQSGRVHTSIPEDS